MTDQISASPLVIRAVANGVAKLTLNRPDARNALSVGLLAALGEALAWAADDPGVRVIVIAGAGPSFCAGHDLREMRADSGRPAMEALFKQCSALMLQIQAVAKPVIAQVHGVATAAGCQLVASCDLAVAADTARFATPGVNIGLFCSTPMVALTRAVGRKVAMEMLLTGDFIDATRAREIGLINRVVPEAALDDEVALLAGAIATKSAVTLAVGKSLFHRQADLDVGAAYRLAGEAMTQNMMARDAAEGIDAFLAKRPPVWSDA